MVTGWDLQDGTWSYYNAYGARVSGWVKDGSWYYLDPATGAMATGWVQVDGTWYLLSASGAMLTGWQMIDGRWYYFASSGGVDLIRIYRGRGRGACVPSLPRPRLWGTSRPKETTGWTHPDAWGRRGGRWRHDTEHRSNPR